MKISKQTFECIHLIYLYYAECSLLTEILLSFFIVVGRFNNKKDVVKKVDLGKPFQFECPQHSPGFGAVYSWVGKLASIALSRNKRRGISPKGTLFITHVTQKDIDEIDGLQGIECRMTAGNSYDNSATLKLEKNNPEQSGKTEVHKSGKKNNNK